LDPTYLVGDKSEGYVTVKQILAAATSSIGFLDARGPFGYVLGDENVEVGTLR